jgi:CxxC motif-containing protein (DUF1111 family)
MNTASATTCLRITLAVVFTWTAAPLAKAELPPSLAPLARGRDLFLHKWTAYDPLSPEGDGLGPVHNAESCVACHRLGGIGGAGPNENNVDLLTVADSKRQRRRADSLPPDKIHPGFGGAGASRTVVLHQFGTIEGYDAWRQKLLGQNRPTRRSRDDENRPVKRLPLYEGHQFLLSQRNTPALFGAAQIDGIPDDVLRDVAQQQQKGSSAVSGRVAPLGEGRLGKFGWRGQTATLRDFVFGACANELGLEVPDQQQGLDPRRAGYRPGGFDLSQQQCEELLAFVAGLPAPERRVVNDAAAATINYGEGLFHSIGCTQCHRRRLGEVDGIYSDLLLHDMGPQLADPLPALPESVLVGRTFSAGYFGGGVVDEFATLDTNVHQEWRTPPLWGAADSAPYLHDGRAATLAAAIALHGGEAGASASAFRSLPAADRTALVAFLQSLTAPAVMR